MEHFFNPSGDGAVRVLRSVKLPGVQFPEFASSEFDFWVCKGDQVLFVIEMKRSTGAVRGNLLKKLSAMQFLLSDAFGGTTHEGMRLSRASFERFCGDAFFDNMYFFARQPVTVRDDEDVFALFMDNEDAFLTALMEVTHLELGSPEFIDQACKKRLGFWLTCDRVLTLDTDAFVKNKYPMSEQDMADYKQGSAAFVESVRRGRVLLVNHMLRPEAFALPKRHKSSVKIVRDE